MKKNVTKEIEALIKDTVEMLGYTLWNVELLRESEGLNLLVTIDKEGGIAIDDCSVVTKAIDPIIDKADPIDGAYFLEVSSVGLDRALKRNEHYDYAVSKALDCKVKLFAPIDGFKEFNGVIKENREDEIVILESGAIHVIPKKSVAKAYVIYEV